MAHLSIFLGDGAWLRVVLENANSSRRRRDALNQLILSQKVLGKSGEHIERAVDQDLSSLAKANLLELFLHHVAVFVVYLLRVEPASQPLTPSAAGPRLVGRREKCECLGPTSIHSLGLVSHILRR